MSLGDAICEDKQVRCITPHRKTTIVATVLLMFGSTLANTGKRIRHDGLRDTNEVPHAVAIKGGHWRLDLPATSQFFELVLLLQ